MTPYILLIAMINSGMVTVGPYPTLKECNLARDEAKEINPLFKTGCIHVVDPLSFLSNGIITMTNPNSGKKPESPAQ